MSVLLRAYPDCAKWTRVEESNYIDIDQQAACLTGYDQRYQQISAGRYHGWFRTALLGQQFGLYFESFNQSLDQWGSCPADHYAFVFLMEGSSLCMLKTQRFDLDCLMYLPPGADFDFSAGPGTRYCVINVARGVFELFIKAHLPEQSCIGSALASSTVIRNRLKTETLRLMVRQALQLADSFTGSPADQGALAGFQTSLAAMLAGYVSHACSNRDGSSDDRQDMKVFPAALAARDYLHETGTAGVDVTELSCRLGVSRRKLEYSFRDQFNKSPAEYIRIVQLNEIRSALLNGANRSLSIGDIAAKFGIWHLSRMAQNYRLQFGELPSETRRLADIATPAPVE